MQSRTPGAIRASIPASLDWGIALAIGADADVVILKSAKQVVFLTSKTLQQKMAVSALVAMNERAFSTLQVRTKEKMCANDRILCHEEFCRFAKNYPEKMAASDILGRLRVFGLDPTSIRSANSSAEASMRLMAGPESTPCTAAARIRRATARGPTATIPPPRSSRWRRGASA